MVRLSTNMGFNVDPCTFLHTMKIDLMGIGTTSKVKLEQVLDTCSKIVFLRAPQTINKACAKQVMDFHLVPLEKKELMAEEHITFPLPSMEARSPWPSYSMVVEQPAGSRQHVQTAGERNVQGTPTTMRSRSIWLFSSTNASGENLWDLGFGLESSAMDTASTQSKWWTWNLPSSRKKTTRQWLKHTHPHSLVLVTALSVESRMITLNIWSNACLIYPGLKNHQSWYPSVTCFAGCVSRAVLSRYASSAQIRSKAGTSATMVSVPSLPATYKNFSNVQRHRLCISYWSEVLIKIKDQVE